MMVTFKSANSNSGKVDVILAWKKKEVKYFVVCIISATGLKYMYVYDQSVQLY